MYNHLFIYPKNELKKTSNRIGLTLLIAFGTNLILSIVLSSLLHFIKHNTVTGLAIYYSFLAIITLLTLFLPFIILTLTTDPTGQNNPLPLKKNSFPKIFTAVIICMGFTYIAQILAAIFQSITSLTPPDLPHDSTPTSIVAEIFTVAIIPGIVEEIIFRGIILGMFRKFGDGFAVFISALLFGISHFNTIQFIFAFIIGLVFGFITVKLNSLLPSIIAHALNNLLATLRSLHLLGAVSYNLISASSLLACMGLIIFISIKDKNIFKLSKTSIYPVRFGEKLKITCCSPAMLIFFIISFLTSLAEVTKSCAKIMLS